MRCVNRHTDAIRQIAKKYTGKPYISSRVMSLQQEINRRLAFEGEQGFNAGARAQLSYTVEQKIIGAIDIQLTIRPPFTMEAFNINLSVTADELT